MTFIFYSELKHVFTDKEINMVNRLYNIEMIKRLEESYSYLYKNRRLTFMCMMINICRFLGIPSSSLGTIYHNHSGKLIMDNYNIAVSYSGGYTFCMLSDFKVGFDVEHINFDVPRNEFEVFNHFFKTDIKDYLTFFKEWTRLESIVKYFDNKGIKDFIYNKLSSKQYGLDTIHIMLDRNYIIAISAEKLYSKKIIYNLNVSNMELTKLKPVDLLPHNGTMLLVDRIIDSDYESFVVTERTVDRNDFYFDGHFPNHPIVPGVFIIEMMFQTCGILVRLSNTSKESNSANIQAGKAVSIKSAKFKKEVSPDSIIQIKATKKYSVMTFTEFIVNAFVGEEEVCNAELIISVQS